ncbi:MAG TPA: phosphoribosyltransferase domain-containing protein [Acinetobacter parvus]|uniref:phosphoribosyltransferase domain-containing protein n=1 Tax=Acinetobacter parvus TaxID=134533 RepID=UPI002C0CB612|nr:phosphoribosyltransferase domain-containing protein [Acinetobacter parvus]HRM15995.1 phosphoribosyltransferase domain-containing protein [Acinetobacter parvus]
MIEIELQRGVLSLQPNDNSHWKWQDLLGFAERINPKRAFLFVSKVLGRHIPVSPSIMRHAFTDLAKLVPGDLPEPVLVIGMAETAVGLGAGVHQVLQQCYPEAIYVTTTRHPVHGAPLLARFLEEHSHAQDQLLYGSPDAELQQQILSSKSIVLVDDEASTGKTFVNLIHALQQAGLNQISHVVTATLADWSSGIHIADLNCQSVALMTGKWQWRDAENPIQINMPKVDTVAFGAFATLAEPTWGRLPIQDSGAHIRLAVQPDERILVLGSGEYVWSSFLLAEYLQQQGADVKFSAITRSPIAVGHAIQSALAFSDNYGLGIQNFVYNINPLEYDRILITVETVADSVAKSLLEALPNAEVISAVDYPHQNFNLCVVND